ncbi:MAG TPA: superoxide dismutase [Pseudonocardia sp.]|jgi:Fe-Mn family superoxide dismutase|uniref:superoxide dismutase n=1 Tax=Pseudonocardia sp. TaxID=60912 RepID=UPI002F3F13C5
MAEYVLPELGYDYAALEPAISGEIMELHHSKHHATYVKGANDALEKLANARESGDYGPIVGVQKALAFNLAGHANHTVFWKNLTAPSSSGEPEGELAAAIAEDFGSFDKLREHMTAVSTTIQGSGWGVLAWEPIGQRLVVQQLQDHQSNLAISTEALLMVDMWEHAFYLQYRNVKADYVKALWTVVNWGDVAARFDAARRAAASVTV